MWDLFYILFVTSNHQTKNLVFTNFFHEIFSAWAIEKKNQTYYWSKTGIFLSFGLMKSLFSFSFGQTEKNSRKKMGKTKFMVWWFDVTNKIDINYYSFLKEGHFARSWHNNLWKYPNMSAALEVSLRINQRKPRPIIYGNWKKLRGDMKHCFRIWSIGSIFTLRPIIAHL